MTKLDIYEGFAGVLIDTIEWRTEHPKLANAYVDGALDMCMVLVRKVKKGGEQDDETGSD